MLTLSPCFPIVRRGVPGLRRAVRFQYRSQGDFIASRIGIVCLLCEPFTAAPILVIHRQVRMHSLEHPDPQFFEFGRLYNQ